MTPSVSLDARNIWSFLLKGVAAENNTVHVDLSCVSFIHPFAMATLGLFLRYWNALGTTFTVLRPTNAKVAAYLDRMQFYSRFNFNRAAVKREQSMRLDASTSLNDIVDLHRAPDIGEKVAKKLFEMMSHFRGKRSANLAEGISGAAGELADNFVAHSGENLGVLTAQYFPRVGRATLVVGDCGCGIRNSLASNREFAYIEDHSDCDAIELALKEGVSCRGEGGMGLSEIADQVKRIGGTLSIFSGTGHVEIRPHDVRRSTKPHFPGVQVQVDLVRGRGKR